MAESTPTLLDDPEKMSMKSESEMTQTESDAAHLQVAEEHDPEKLTKQPTKDSTKSGHQPQRFVTAQDWSGPDDPGNPLNWSLWNKIFHTLIPGLQCFTITFGSSIYTPGIFDTAHYFGVSPTVAILPLTVYVLGLGFGPVISAPLSETFGRRSVYIILFLPSLLFTMGSGFANNIATLIICRFFAGLLGSGCLAVGAGTNSDLWSPLSRAAASSVFLMAPFAGPALGPPVGGFVVMKKNWRWTQWPVLFIGVLSYAITLFSSETYKKIILQRRAKKLGLPPPPNPLPPGLARIKFLLFVTVLRPIRMLFTESIVAFLSIYTAFNFSVLFGFFAAFPLVFSSPYPEIQIYHFNIGEGGLVFLGIGLGVALSTITFIIIDRLTYRKKTLAKRATGDMTPLPPEERLQAAMVGSILLPISLFWFAWSARPSVHWISPILATVPFGMGNLLIFCSTILYLIDTYGPLGGASAAAANGLLRYVLGAVFPLFTVQMYRAMGVAWATSLLGFVTIACLPIPWVLYKYGSTIRKRSAYT